LQVRKKTFWVETGELTSRLVTVVSIVRSSSETAKDGGNGKGTRCLVVVFCQHQEQFYKGGEVGTPGGTRGRPLTEGIVTVVKGRDRNQRGYQGERENTTRRTKEREEEKRREKA
jgi:hypothetical protein